MYIAFATSCPFNQIQKWKNEKEFYLETKAAEVSIDWHCTPQSFHCGLDVTQLSAAPDLPLQIGLNYRVRKHFLS